jgi:hypothetical protein
MYTKTGRRSGLGRNEQPSVPETKPAITSTSQPKKHNNLLPPTDFGARIFNSLSGFGEGAGPILTPQRRRAFTEMEDLPENQKDTKKDMSHNNEEKKRQRKYLFKFNHLVFPPTPVTRR